MKTIHYFAAALWLLSLSKITVAADLMIQVRPAHATGHKTTDVDMTVTHYATTPRDGAQSLRVSEGESAELTIAKDQWQLTGASSGLSNSVQFAKEQHIRYWSLTPLRIAGNRIKLKMRWRDDQGDGANTRSQALSTVITIPMGIWVPLQHSTDSLKVDSQSTTWSTSAQRPQGAALEVRIDEIP